MGGMAVKSHLGVSLIIGLGHKNVRYDKYHRPNESLLSEI